MILHLKLIQSVNLKLHNKFKIISSEFVKSILENLLLYIFIILH